jgi:HK97 family phage prohead protease
MTTRHIEAATARAAGVRAPADRPQQRRSAEDEGSLPTVRVRLDPPSELRSVDRNGMACVAVGGYASTTEQGYEMYDFWGPYTEVVSAGAFGSTLTASPLVEFTVNHGAGGALPMAHTRNDTLDLVEDEGGLRYDAYVDPTRSDVADMLKALQRGDLAESSFKFRITKGIWSPDYTEYRIEAVDLERGDVSAVNYGANPNASSGLRAQRATPKPVVPSQAPRSALSPNVRALLELALAD